MVIPEVHNNNVALVRLNRPEALNALCDGLINELNAVLLAADNNPTIGCIVITGNEKAFAAGADIKEMKDRTFPEVYSTQMLGHWNAIEKIKYDDMMKIYSDVI
jgi:enoyl-CoA hydratase